MNKLYAGVIGLTMALVLAGPVIAQTEAQTGTQTADFQGYAEDYAATRLDRDKNDSGFGLTFARCVISGTYDANAWDKNYDKTRDPFQKAFPSAITPNPTGVELVQWSWAKRARCQTSIGTASADTTAFFAVGYLWASQEHADRPRAVKDIDMTRLGVLTLLPAVIDNLRAVGPTRRYYTSAILGTSLMAARNNRLKADIEALKTVVLPASDLPAMSCAHIQAVKFKLSTDDAGGINVPQAQLTTDITAYNAWCDSAQDLFDKVWVLRSQNDRILNAFQSDRVVTWRDYATAVNTGGYEQQATTTAVLHRIIALPITVASDIVGTDKTAYSLGDNRVQLDATDAATLPVAGGDYSFTAPTTDVVALSLAINKDIKTLRSFMDPIAKSATPKSKLKVSYDADDNSLKGLNAESLLTSSTGSAQTYLAVKDLLTDITALNAQRYLILELNSGGAHLATQSLASIKQSTTVGTTTTTATVASK